MIRDLITVADHGFARLHSRMGEVISGRQFGLEEHRSVVEVNGWVNVLMRERGKIVPGSRRSGHNIWTDTGREYLALLMCVTYDGTNIRNDRVAYIGVGIGTQPEDSSVLSLITPIAFDITGRFLADLDSPPTFPLTPARTTVRFHRTFADSEITTVPGTINVTELGLFTNGSPSAIPPYNPGTRDRTLANASSQAPVAYKAFEPIGKTNALEMEVSWEIRF